MLHRYNSFRGDLLLENAINESMIYYTRDFKDCLIKLRNNKSIIAQNLLEVEYTDVKPDMTFISLGDKEGDIKFTQFKKALSIIKNELDVKINDNDLKQQIEDKLINGNITQGTIFNLYDSYGVSAKSRNSTGVGRLVNQIFPGKYTSKEVEEFVNNYKNANKPKEYKFILVKGEDIRKYYLNTNYEEEVGDLGNSCMRYRGCQEYLDIYVENPDIVQLLVYVNSDDKVLGRALVWKLNDNKSLDNVTFQNENSDYVRMSIKLDNSEFDYYPYMDTFKRLNVNDQMLYNDSDEEDWGLTNTNGSYEDYNGVYSDYLDERIPEDEAVYSEYVDSWIYRDDAVEVTTGSRRYKGWYPENYSELVYDRFRNEYLHENDCVYSGFLDDSYYENDNIYIITGAYSDDIYDWSINKMNFDIENVSDNYREIISNTKLACEPYLDYNDSYENFYKGMLEYSPIMDKYYISDLKIEVYNTKQGMLSKEHCDLLGIKTNTESYYTDELHYLFKNPNIDKIIEAIDEKISYYTNVLNGNLPNIEFEDQEEYIKKVENKVRLLNLDKEILENFKE